MAREQLKQTSLDVVLALSGPICAGKSTLARGLSAELCADILSTRELLHQLTNTRDRATLQDLGEALDRQYGHHWMTRPALRQRAELPSESLLIIDAVRTLDQLSGLRLGAHVLHVHLTAPDPVLEGRYEQRVRRAISELSAYGAVRSSPTEAAVEALARVADVVLRTDALSIDETRAEVARHFRAGSS